MTIPPTQCRVDVSPAGFVAEDGYTWGWVMGVYTVVYGVEGADQLAWYCGGKGEAGAIEGL